MKKDLIFVPAMLLVGVLLFLFDMTGKPAHIAISVAGVFILAIYTSFTKNEWKIPVLEIVSRIFYGVALISGVIVMKVSGVAALAIAHKFSAGLFVALFLILFVHKLLSRKGA